MATIGNNLNKEYSLVRNAFFTEEETKHFEKMLQNPIERREQENLKYEHADVLYRKARHLMDRVENGEFNDRQMKEVECAIAHLLAAIEDCEQVAILEL